jgi:hypothetical protein
MCRLKVEELGAKDENETETRTDSQFFVDAKSRRVVE